MATIYEVSRLAGVSLATVSRVLNGTARVRPETRDKVEAAMDALGYQPSAIAQSLAGNRSNSVGILVPELHGPFFGAMLGGIESKLRSAGKSAVVTAGHSDEAKERAGLEFLISRRCDALIVHVDAISDAELAERCQGPVPLVVINRTSSPIADRSISLDNELGGYLATRHLIEHGHRRIGCITGPLWKADARERLTGYRKALSESGMVMGEGWICEGDYSDAGGRMAMQNLIASAAPVTALFCANDEMAAGAMEEARAFGMRVPTDLSFVGFDNVNFSAYLHPKLSTVDYPIAEMGAMAAQWVLSEVYNMNEEPIRHLFSPRLVERQSVRELAS